MESKAVVSLTNGKKAFGNNEVLKDISLTVNAGDVLAIIGPSGGGKSTLLRCMTLLETLDSGDLSYGDLTVCANDAAGRAVYGGKDVIAAAKTRFGLVFQNFTLFPHYTVLQNVTAALICVQRMPSRAVASCWPAWAWRTRNRWCRATYPAVSSSVWPSPGPWP